MSRWAGLRVTMGDASCPLARLRAECDTGLIWSPEADAEAELRPGPETPEFGLVEARVRHSLGLWRLSVETEGELPDSPHRPETSLERRGWCSHVVSSNHPSLNIAYGCKHINWPQTNITRKA